MLPSLSTSRHWCSQQQQQQWPQRTSKPKLKLMSLPWSSHSQTLQQQLQLQFTSRQLCSLPPSSRTLVSEGAAQLHNVTESSLADCRQQQEQHHSKGGDDPIPTDTIHKTCHASRALITA
mmetsp:Transcript_39695/g.59385  ORF Transcript_39695/g.59385 Transcript_39695/m.59385 type:complete len:120 (-) Transcript_39695:8-367(-)